MHSTISISIHEKFQIFYLFKGHIKHGAKRGQILRLSQTPYFPCGHLSLFQQISFPATGISNSLERIDNGNYQMNYQYINHICYLAS